MARKLVVIDDDPAGGRLLAAIFAGEGLSVSIAADGARGLELAAAEHPDAVVLDLHLPDLDGLEVLERLLARAPGLPVVMLTAHTEVKTAVRAIRLGAFDYMTKPVDPDGIVVTVRRALELRALREEVVELRRRMGAGGGLVEQMGPSPAIGRVAEQVTTVAATDFSVLVTGETGAGKELVAQAIHRLSPRHAAPFVALDCGAIPEALLESELFGHERGAFTGADRRRDGQFTIAAGGTVFLDEIGNLALGLQAKLLRVLESRRVQAVGAASATALDVRFVAATNDDLAARVEAGAFRSDLYFRLAQYAIALPPLRARAADIPYLARRFLDEVAVELRRPLLSLSAEALDFLGAQPWPGNARQLRNAIRRAALDATDPVLVRAVFQDVPAADAATRAGEGHAPAASGGRSLREIADSAAREAERRAIVEALRAAGGNKAEAARALRTDYKTLHVKIKQLGLRADDRDPPQR
jgi:DNA-binding NtrC family response regulator